MKKIIYTRADGGLSVVTPVINTHTLVDGVVVPISEDITETEAIERAIFKLPKDALDVRVVDETDIPRDRTFRNAWKVGVKGIEYDMDKAREIHKTHLRILRAHILAELDTAYMRADETGNVEEKRTIAIKKQKLRDITESPDIMSAKTVEQLQQVSLPILNA